ncbi:stage III sporulation protein AH [Proteinivorax tanatarense]|uniref:Stage III sporulation protein AH n=1 Tax=Proteinivorax tanatarense TaxID=1260629 RepID=A0AAU7VMH5_9FIRM
MIHIVIINIKNPTKQVYKDLLAVAFEVCDIFVLVVRKDLDKNDSLNTILQRLEPFLIKSREQSKWPGTTTYGEEPVAKVHYYRTDNAAKDILIQAADSLYKWIQPELPEDLSFLKREKEWLINTSHEKDCLIITNEKAEINNIVNIEGIKTKMEKIEG